VPPPPAASARSATPATTAQHLHVVADDLGRVTRDTRLVLPLASAQAALNVDLRAFLQVLGGDFAQPAEENHPVPLRALLLLAALLVAPAFAGGNAQIGDGGAGWHGAGLGIRPEIADQNDFIDTARHIRRSSI